MESSFKFADLDNDKKVMDLITSLERDLSEKTGQDIVLIAYDGRYNPGKKG